MRQRRLTGMWCAGGARLLLLVALLPARLPAAAVLPSSGATSVPVADAGLNEILTDQGDKPPPGEQWVRCSTQELGEDASCRGDKRPGFRLVPVVAEPSARAPTVTKEPAAVSTRVTAVHATATITKKDLLASVHAGHTPTITTASTTSSAATTLSSTPQTVASFDHTSLTDTSLVGSSASMPAPVTLASTGTPNVVVAATTAPPAESTTSNGLAKGPSTGAVSTTDGVTKVPSTAAASTTDGITKVASTDAASTTAGAKKVPSTVNGLTDVPSVAAASTTIGVSKAPTTAVSPTTTSPPSAVSSTTNGASTLSSSAVSSTNNGASMSSSSAVSSTTNGASTSASGAVDLTVGSASIAASTATPASSSRPSSAISLSGASSSTPMTSLRTVVTEATTAAAVSSGLPAATSAPVTTSTSEASSKITGVTTAPSSTDVVSESAKETSTASSKVPAASSSTSTATSTVPSTSTSTTTATSTTPVTGAPPSPALLDGVVEEVSGPPSSVVRTELGSTTIMTTEDAAVVGPDDDAVDPLEDGAGLHGDVLEDADEVLMADQPYVVEVPHFPSDLDAKLGSLDCVVPPLPPQSILWRANQTHELELPLTVPVDCAGPECPPPALGWEATAAMQSGDVLLVRIDSAPLELELDKATSAPQAPHQPQEAVYGVTREEMAGCDVAQGLLLDITPLPVDGKMLLALYDKDLSDGDNFLVILSERWAPGRCVRLHVLMKSDNCGENQDCSGKGVCYSKDSMEGFECQCCPGYLGPHCEERDACLPSPCLNQGICLDVSQGHEDTQFSCLCPYGFTGDRCEVVTDPCDSEPCRNGGSCRRSARNGTQWWCQCAPGFHGVQCERPVLALAAPEDPVVVAPATQVAAVVVAPAASPCVPSPCKYGLCISKGGQASCYCQPGFTGKRCDLQFRMCGSMPCLNGGDCVDVVDGFTCKCGPGYSGERCENKVPLCHDKSCRAGQECVDLGNTITCRCPVGTSSPDCKPTPAPPKPCSSSPCRHGGTCYNSDRGFYCACRPGYTGTTCNGNAAR